MKHEAIETMLNSLDYLTSNPGCSHYSLKLLPA